MKTEESCIRDCANVIQINEAIVELNQVDEDLQSVAAILNLAGNETRIKILYLVHHYSEICVCDLSDMLNLSVSAISQQLRKLKDGELLTSSKIGKTIFYKISPEKKEIIQLILSLSNHSSINKKHEILSL